MTSKNHAVIRFEKHKTAQQIGASESHNLRQKFVLNADPNRRHQNRIVVGNANSLWDSIHENLRERNVKVRSTNVLCVEAILTATKFDGINLDKWIESNVKFLNEQFGKENVLRVVLHLDESTPHLHANIIPVARRPDGTNALNARKWLGGRQALSALQSQYATAMSGFGLERGVEGSVATHTDAREFKRLTTKARRSLPEALAAIRKILTPPYHIKHRDGSKETLAPQKLKPMLNRVPLESVENNERVTKFQLKKLEQFAVEQAETLVAQQIEIQRQENQLAQFKQKARTAQQIASDERATARSLKAEVDDLTSTIAEVNAFDPTIINQAREQANEQRKRKRQYARNTKSRSERNPKSKPSANVESVDRTNANRRNQLDRG